MQKFLKRFMLIGMASLFLSCATVYAQDTGSNKREGRSSNSDQTDFSKMEMTQKDAERMAQMLLKEDIRSGTLTLKQAGEYYKCTQKDYAASFAKASETSKYKKNLERLSDSSKLSAAERAELDAEMKKSGKEFEMLQGQAEDRCMKALGLSVPRGKVFGRNIP